MWPLNQNGTAFVEQYQKRLEAERQMAADEEALRKKMDAAKARKEAEKIHQVSHCYSQDVFRPNSSVVVFFFLYCINLCIIFFYLLI